MPHNFKVDASLHFSPCPRNIRNITKDEMCQHYFSRINSGKKARKNLEDVFLSRFSFIIIFKWDVALATIFVFSTNEQVDCYFF